MTVYCVSMVLWGHKTIAMFDLWTIEHFMTGIGLAFLADIISRKASGRFDLNNESRKFIGLLIVISASLFWECLEHYLETGLIPGYAGERVVYWFQGVEHWSNRLIGDTLAIVLGWRLYQWRPKIALPAKIFSITWMAVHIFIFPDSMYLQRLLFP